MNRAEAGIAIADIQEGLSYEIESHEVRSPILSLGGLLEVLHLRERTRVDSKGRELIHDNSSYRSLYDLGGPISLSQGSSGPLGALGRMKANRQIGKPITDGLSWESFGIDPKKFKN
jgi:hypothetical protein